MIPPQLSEGKEVGTDSSFICNSCVQTTIHPHFLHYQCSQTSTCLEKFNVFSAANHNPIDLKDRMMSINYGYFYSIQFNLLGTIPRETKDSINLCEYFLQAQTIATVGSQ
jgi:hypothetical protein